MSEPLKVKLWYKSRTNWIAILQAVAGVAVILAESFPMELGFLAIGKSVLDVVLRSVTNGPVTV